MNISIQNQSLSFILLKRGRYVCHLPSTCIQQEAKAPLPLQLVQGFSSKVTTCQVHNEPESGCMHSELVP